MTTKDQAEAAVRKHRASILGDPSFSGCVVKEDGLNGAYVLVYSNRSTEAARQRILDLFAPTPVRFTEVGEIKAQAVGEPQ